MPMNDSYGTVNCTVFQRGLSKLTNKCVALVTLLLCLLFEAAAYTILGTIYFLLG